jgi:hypothetical protein
MAIDFTGWAAQSTPCFLPGKEKLKEAARERVSAAIGFLHERLEDNSKKPERVLVGKDKTWSGKDTERAALKTGSLFERLAEKINIPRDQGVTTGGGSVDVTVEGMSLGGAAPGGATR